MIRQRDIRQFECRFHRNGVTGASFYVCSFMLYRGKDETPMRAIVFARKGHVAVTSDDISAKYRGDDFESALREAIKLVEKNQPDTIHAIGPVL